MILKKEKDSHKLNKYLIEQLQFTGTESVSSRNNKYRLNFNHPSKFLVWAVRTSGPKDYIAWAHDGDWDAACERAAEKVLKTDDNFDGDGVGDITTLADANESVSITVDSNKLVVNGIVNDSKPQVITHNITREDLDKDWSTVSELKNHLITVHDHFNYSSTIYGEGNPVKSARLQLNGHERFTERDGAYFNYVQPYQHFTCTPSDGINVYSFALEPEKHQPSGTCNFSRIDNTTLNVTLNEEPDNDIINIYTVNYNVLRVMSGMAGVAYSN